MICKAHREELHHKTATTCVHILYCIEYVALWYLPIGVYSSEQTLVEVHVVKALADLVPVSLYVGGCGLL